jgi:predicted alpha/beta superfamily hydrolase
VKIQFIVEIPDQSEGESRIFLAGNLGPMGAWKPDGLPLARTNGHYTGMVELPRGKTLEYKVTRGTWESVEKGPGGEEVKNRTLLLDGSKTERVAVATWSSAQPRVLEHTITGDVRSLDIHSGILGNDRKLWVFLPPGYAQNPNARYPVLYMHDGQNVFDDATSFAGEWQADETATALIESGRIEPIIIVGIENNIDRVDEYTPTRYLQEGGNGDAYGRFVVEEVKPLIDRAFRTRPGPDETGVAGSSLGAIISLHLMRTYPQIFGRGAAISPSLWWDRENLLYPLQKDTSWAKGKRVWLDTGTMENGNALRSGAQVADCRQLGMTLERKGFVPGREFVYREYTGAGHNEQAWAERFGDVLLFLYGKP